MDSLKIYFELKMHVKTITKNPLLVATPFGSTLLSDQARFGTDSVAEEAAKFCINDRFRYCSDVLLTHPMPTGSHLYFFALKNMPPMHLNSLRFQVVL